MFQINANCRTRQGTLGQRAAVCTSPLPTTVDFGFPGTEPAHPIFSSLQHTSTEGPQHWLFELRIFAILGWWEGNVHLVATVQCFTLAFGLFQGQ